MEKCQVVFMPSKIEVEIEKGATILDAAQQAGISMKSSCGGQGTCGRCTVKVLEGQVSGGEGNMSRKKKAEGYILACTAIVEGDVKIKIPPESVLHEHQVLLDEEEDGLLMEKQIEANMAYADHPFVKKVQVSLSEPSLVENASDWSRLTTELKGILETDEITITHRALQQLPHVLRADDWKATVTCLMQENGAEVIRTESGHNEMPPYGIALDIGTTTVVAALIDLESGRSISQAGTYNRQAAYGDDVITRIIFAEEDNIPESGPRSSHQETDDDGIHVTAGLHKLQDVVLETINVQLDKIYAEQGLKKEDVSIMMVAANTTMTHLFYGVEPSFIRREPYIPAATTFPIMKAKELGIKINPDGNIISFPSVASYVGGDVVSGAFLVEMEQREEISLFIDIGTNGEMVLGNSDWQMCCACSAGPAFEGGGIDFGMRAMPGAIEKIQIDKDNDYRVSYVTVNDESPVGICGSGLIDCLAKLRTSGVIDRQGHMQKVDTPRLRQGDEGPEFVIAWSEETGFEKDITLSEADIQNLIRAKGAVFAGIRVMLNMMDLPIEAIEKILIGGGFGNYLNLKDSISIGLLPDLPGEQYEFIGNSSLKGAHKALLSRKAFEHAVELGRGLTYLELSLGNAFMDEYVSAMFLPHTDLSLFPSISE